jgi:hypothetical protein
MWDEDALIVTVGFWVESYLAEGTVRRWVRWKA